MYDLDLISATDGSGDQTYFTYDGLGSTADLTDDQGAEVDDYTYDVFGAIRTQSGSSDNYWLFTGEQSDGDEGLYYLRARYYDPASGRFLGRDPVPFVNRYAYVENNPVRFVDPYGLDVCETIGGIFGKKKKCKDVADETLDSIEETGQSLYTNVIAPGVQIGDIISQFAVNAPVVRTGFDLAAAVSASIDIWTSCLSVGEKIGLTGLNAVNLGVGVYAGTNPAAIAGAVAAESVIYGFTTHYLTDKCGDLNIVYARLAPNEKE